VTNPEQPQRYVKYAMTVAVYKKMPDLTTEAYSSFSSVYEAMDHDQAAYGEDPAAFLDTVDNAGTNGKTEFYWLEVGRGECPDPDSLDGGGGA
jgi:hypothetical protein